MANDELRFQLRDDGVAVITFNRPQARNALTFAMYDALLDACRRVAAEPQARVLVLHGAGDHAFAAGTDVEPLKTLNTREKILDYEAHVDTVFAALEHCPKPTIAAIAGACTGAGLIIASCCDLRIAASNAKIGMPVARTLGNALGTANVARLLRLLGEARLKELVFTARLIDAREAHAAGLVSQVVEEPTQALAEALVLAGKIAQHAPMTLRATKQTLARIAREGPGADNDDLVAATYLSEDFAEGVAAFQQKRPAQWRGR
jgi:enoyl-CoA hydratase